MCSNSIKKEEKWEAFQRKCGVSKNEDEDRVYYKLGAIVEFYCSNCQIAEGEKGGKNDTLPPPIQAKNRTSLIENESEEELYEVKDELGESDKQNKLLEKVKNLREIITTLLEQMEEKTKLLKEVAEQKKVQESKKLEEEINQLEKELSQKKQDLEKLLLEQKQLLIKIT